MPSIGSGEHPFVRHPHRTFLALSWPVLLALIADPVAGLVDTAFLARTGSVAVAALGIATVLLAAVSWVFNFLGIGTQTEVARLSGRRAASERAEAATLAIGAGVTLGAVLSAVAWPLVPAAVRAMGGSGETHAAAVAYLRVRLFGTPAILAMLAAYGALRGIQDMRTPLRIAVGSTALNVALDPVLIFGAGPVPALGIAGAAWATVLAHWSAAALAVAAVRSAVGWRAPRAWSPVWRLVVVGRDLVLRTALLMAFVALATRRAMEAGPDAGAAHHAIRQVWMLTALLLDAFAAATQSLVGFFHGAARGEVALRVVRVGSLWAIATGLVLAMCLLGIEPAVRAALVPGSAAQPFALAWPVAAAAQPLNAVAFLTDGVHWGTGDYRYLRNAMLAATALGALGLLLLEPSPAAESLRRVWLVTAAWIAVRAAFGTLRIWPGIGKAPLRLRAPASALPR